MTTPKEKGWEPPLSATDKNQRHAKWENNERQRLSREIRWPTYCRNTADGIGNSVTIPSHLEFRFGNNIGGIGYRLMAPKPANFRLKLFGRLRKERIGKSQASLCPDPPGVIRKRSIKFKGNLSNRRGSRIWSETEGQRGWEASRVCLQPADEITVC